jgi:hypothetical protein
LEGVRWDYARFFPLLYGTAALFVFARKAAIASGESQSGGSAGGSRGRGRFGRTRGSAGTGSVVSGVAVEAAAPPDPPAPPWLDSVTGGPGADAVSVSSSTGSDSDVVRSAVELYIPEG